MKALITEIDKYKEKINGYKPHKAELVHSHSAKLADKAFHKAMKGKKYLQVILMNGGSASGKTEFVSSELIEEKVIVYDSTLSSIEGANIKIKSVLKNKKIVKIIASAY